MAQFQLAKTAYRLQVVKRHIIGIPKLPLRVMVRHLSAGQGSLSTAASQVLDTRKSVDILDSRISYLDTEVGDKTVIFLHGNPTSAFLWRNIIPHVKSVARCLAPDLIGMGHSGKPDIQYKFAEHYRYLSASIDAMKLPKKVSIVCHDWGSGLGFHWCHQNQNRVESIVFMEAIVSAVVGWEQFPQVARNIFQALRTNAGEELIYKKNFFVERIFPGSMMRKLTEEEMTEYRAPFLEEKSRLPTLTWPREIPVMGDGPDDVINVANNYEAWLKKSAEVPKLYIDGNPGFFSPGIRETVKNWPNLKTVQVKGLHFLQEDSPDEIAEAIQMFLQGVFSRA